MRGDDGFGPKLIAALRGRTKAAVFDCGTAPENYIIPILNSSPGTVILLGAEDFKAYPGDVEVFGTDRIRDVPRLIVDLFRTGDSNLNIFMVAMQPKDTSFGAVLSEETKTGIEKLQRIFVKLLCQ